jgi:hypothetical protein
VYQVQKVPVTYIFIGSSRVAASISSTEFAQATGEANSLGSAMNMGRGYSTLVEHYFGLRRIAAAMPDGLKGVTVFLEAPGGSPDLETWWGNWLYYKNPDLLVNTIGLSDLRSFWARDSSNFDLKLAVTASTLSEAIAKQGYGWAMLEGIKDIIFRHWPWTKPNKADSPASGGIRTDEAGIQNARRLAISLAADDMKQERIFLRQSGDETVLKSINDLVLAGGGRLILYRMPLSSVQEQVYTTAIGRKNREITHDLLKAWAIPMLSSNMKTNDDDFPDYWHLRKSRRSEFTRSLAEAYIDSRWFPGRKRQIINNIETLRQSADRRFQLQPVPAGRFLARIGLPHSPAPLPGRIPAAGVRPVAIRGNPVPSTRGSGARSNERQAAATRFSKTATHARSLPATCKGESLP